MDGTTQLLETDRRYLVHSLHHPDDHRQPLVVTEGRGAMLRDADGREYIDGLSGLWNVNVGHGRAELAASASSARPWPTLTFHRPESPSMHSRPSASLSIAPRPSVTTSGCR